MQYLVLNADHNISWQVNQDGMFYNIAGSRPEIIPLQRYYNEKYDNWFTTWGYAVLSVIVLGPVFYDFNSKIKVTKHETWVNNNPLKPTFAPERWRSPTELRWLRRTGRL